MYVAEAVLGEVNAAVTALHQTIETTTTKVAGIAAFGHITTALIRWSWLVLLLVVTWQLSPRTTGLLITALAATVLFRLSLYPVLVDIMQNDTVLVHYASGVRVSLPVAFLSCSLLIIVGMGVSFYRLYMKRRRISTRFQHHEYELPFSAGKRLYHDHFDDPLL